MALPPDLVTPLRAWQQAHPQATLADIEAEVARLLAQTHAELVQDLLAQRDPLPSPTCPDCQQPMQASGQRTRHLLVRSGADVTLTRSYYVCPACGTGLFPPG
jgi:hypothetical protein